MEEAESLGLSCKSDMYGGDSQGDWSQVLLKEISTWGGELHCFVEGLEQGASNYWQRSDSVSFAILD